MPHLRSAGVLVALLVAGCGSEAEPAQDSGPTGEVVVFAAASLTGAFDDIAEAFEAEEGVRVVANYGGSSGLAQQVLSGAPGDVFAAASPATMQTVVDGGEADGEPVVFARNRLEIAVPADDPGGVTGLEDLADPARTIALCSPEVPCGAASVKAFQSAGLTPAPDTLEQDVKAVLAKVRLGEVDAALVYRTDVLDAGADVKGIPFPEADGAVNDYPITVLDGAEDAEAAQAFVDFVLGPRGQEVLRAAGFEVG